MPVPMKITGRFSSMTNAFINAMIPVIRPTEEQVEQALRILGMDQDGFCCAYCGDVATEWDHLRPLVKNKKPTGFISEIHNLVPACGKCNQSKGNKNWRSWMLGPAKLSPATRGITDLDARVERIDAYAQWGAPVQMDFEQVAGEGLWAEHWHNWSKIQELMKQAQTVAGQIQDAAVQALAETTTVRKGT